MATKSTKSAQSAKRSTPAQSEPVPVPAGTQALDPTPEPDTALVSEIASVSERCNKLEKRVKELESTPSPVVETSPPQATNCRCDVLEEQVASLQALVNLCADNLKHDSGPGFKATLGRLRKGQ